MGVFFCGSFYDCVVLILMEYVKSENCIKNLRLLRVKIIFLVVECYFKYIFGSCKYFVWFLEEVKFNG